jgi:hypothetical protein
VVTDQSRCGVRELFDIENWGSRHHQYRNSEFEVYEAFLKKQHVANLFVCEKDPHAMLPEFRTLPT